MHTRTRIAQTQARTHVRTCKAHTRSITAVAGGRPRAAGATWTSRTMAAGWAGRYGHMSVVDAIAGAIHVIGGQAIEGNYNDVWVSTDGGANQDSRRVLGYSGGSLGVL